MKTGYLLIVLIHQSVLQNRDRDLAAPLPASAASNASIQINISAEVDQCAVWKHLNEESHARNRKRQLVNGPPVIPEHGEVPSVIVERPLGDVAVELSKYCESSV